MTIYPVVGDKNDLLKEVYKIGCDEKAISILSKKFNVLPIKVTDLKPSRANIIKQEMLSSKGDVVVNSKSISCTIDKTDALLLGTEANYQDFIRKMEFQNSPYLIELSKQIKKIIENYYNRLPSQMTRNNKVIDYSRPNIMGILNVTKDSFYDGGKYTNLDKAIVHCEEMIKDGVDIIDIGAESTRPGATPVPAEEEIERVIPILEKIKKEFDIVISVDTYKSIVAEEALKAGADIINDISGFSFDENMIDVVKRYNAITVIMHIQGKPQNMQINPVYSDVVRELIEYFDEKIYFASTKGYNINNLIIDPGIGFGKKLSHNIEIIKNIPAFKKYGLPVMIGVSRKSMIGMIMGNTDSMNEKVVPVEDRLYGTLGLNAMAIMKGVDIIRVHDVKAHAHLIKIIQAMK